MKKRIEDKAKIQITAKGILDHEKMIVRIDHKQPVLLYALYCRSSMLLPEPDAGIISDAVSLSARLICPVTIRLMDGSGLVSQWSIQRRFI